MDNTACGKIVNEQERCWAIWQSRVEHQCFKIYENNDRPESIETAKGKKIGDENTEDRIESGGA